MIFSARKSQTKLCCIYSLIIVCDVAVASSGSSSNLSVVEVDLLHLSKHILERPWWIFFSNTNTIAAINTKAAPKISINSGTMCVNIT